MFPTKKALLISGLLLISMSGCILDKLKQAPEPSTTNPEDAIEPPTLTLTLPVTLSSTVAAKKASFTDTLSVRQSGSVADCGQYFDAKTGSNFLENGYVMTKFLVGLSQAQSCFADFLMKGALIGGKPLIGKGVIALPNVSTNSDSPTHVKIDLSDSTYKVWMLFATPGSALPTNTGDLKQIYITWTTTSTGDISGKFYIVNMPENAADPNAPRGFRVDFSRTSTEDRNQIFLQMATNQSSGITGFRVDVAKKIAGSSVSYQAQGRMEFKSAGLFSNLPQTETFAVPVFTVYANLDDTGNGAAKALYHDFAMHLASDGSDGKAPWSFGSYQYDLSDKSYFDSTATTTWHQRKVETAHYVNTSGTNLRSGKDLATMKLCLEIGGCPGMPAQGLGTGYFTSTCADTNNAACTDFIAWLYDNGLFGAVKNDTAATEPTDNRQTNLNSGAMLTTIHPDQEDGSTTFVVPTIY